MSTLRRASASLPLPPATSTSAARAPRSSTGCTPAATAARSSSASRTPTRSAPPPDRCKAILDGLEWLGIDWDEGPEVGGAYGPYFQTERLDALQEHADQLIAAGQGLPLLLHEGGARARGAQVFERAEAAPTSTRAPAGSGRTPARQAPPVVRFKMPADRRDAVVRRPGLGTDHQGVLGPRRLRDAPRRTASRSTTSAASSTTT